MKICQKLVAEDLGQPGHEACNIKHETMGIEEIKSKLFSPKLELILKSEFEFLYRDLVDFIVEKYKAFEAGQIPANDLTYILPCAILDNLDFKPVQETDLPLSNYIQNVTNQDQPWRAETKVSNFLEKEENAIVNLILRHQTNLTIQQISERLRYLTIEQKETLTNLYFENTGNYSLLNFHEFTVETAVDFLTLEKIKKSEIPNLLISPPTLHNNYFIPESFVNSSFHGDYISIMKRAMDFYYRLYPNLSTPAFYIIPLAFMQKIIFTININKLMSWDFSFVPEALAQIKKNNFTLYQLADSVNNQNLS